MFDKSVPPLLLSAQARAVGSDRQLHRRADRGELVKLRDGVYVDATIWHGLKVDARYRVRVHAAAAKLSNGTRFSHDSAAAAWHLPTIGPWPSGVHVLSEFGSGARSSRGIARHGIEADPGGPFINNAQVTTLERTVIDIARTSPFIRAVCATDAAFRPPEDESFRALNHVPAVSAAALASELETLSGMGLTRAARVISFGTEKSGSVGESLSRAHFHLMGFPPPELQVPFYDEYGFIGYVDFYWPELDLIGEFDGDIKYLGQTYRRGRLPEEVVLDEKRREDRLRRVARSLVRWDWSVALDQRLLAARVRPHGLLPVR